MRLGLILPLLVLLALFLPLATPSRAAIPPDSEVYKAFLVQSEGCSYHPYPDPAPPHQIDVGIGHKLAIVEPYKDRYDDVEVNRFFLNDLQLAMHAAEDCIGGFDTLPLAAKEVTIGVIWCVGPHGFRRFVRYRAALSEHRYSDAAQELLNSRWATQVSASRSGMYERMLQSLDASQ